MSTIPRRGEVSLKLGEREVVLRPTFAALVAIERETGMGLLVLGRKLAQGSIEHVPVVICEGAKAAGHEVQREEVEAEVTVNGAFIMTNSAAELLANGIDGGAERRRPPAAEITTG